MVIFSITNSLLYAFPYQVNWLSSEWAKRAALPSHVVTMLDNFPTNLHPMSQFSAAITALNSESTFARAYSEGVNKAKYWEVRPGKNIRGPVFIYDL